MGKRAIQLIITEDELKQLRDWAKNGKTEQRLAFRAKLILLLNDGNTNKATSSLLGVSEVTVCKWRKRFYYGRANGLKDSDRSGRRISYGHDDRIKLIRKTLEEPADSTWTMRGLEEALKGSVGIKKSQIQRILKGMDLKPHKVNSWLDSKDPQFEQKALEICGLYINPPDNALIISVDEKPAIQAIGRKNQDKPMKPGRPTRRDFEYVRHGTVDLFAAFLVQDGSVIGMPSDRHTAEDFLDFLEHLNDELPKDKVIHIIMDNLSSHKTAKVMKWFDNHLRWTIHFTPTHGSWLNQVELWFSILSKKVLKNSVFNKREDLITSLMEFIERYNKTCKPFKWTYKGTPLII